MINIGVTTILWSSLYLLPGLLISFKICFLNSTGEPLTLMNVSVEYRSSKHVMQGLGWVKSYRGWGKISFLKPALLYQMDIWPCSRKEYLSHLPSQCFLSWNYSGRVYYVCHHLSFCSLQLCLVTLNAGPRSKDLTFVWPGMCNIHTNITPASCSILPDLWGCQETLPFSKLQVTSCIFVEISAVSVSWHRQQ